MKALFSTKAALAAALLLGTGLAAHAQTITGGATPVSVGTNFTTLFGADGSVQFDTFPSGQAGGNFVGLTNIVTQVAAGGNGTPVNLITKPGYVSSIDGVTGTFNAAAGYGYPDISPGNEAGLAGYTSGNLFSFTLGSGTPASFVFGVLTNYGSTGEVPGTIILTSGAASASDTPNTAVANSGFNNLFTITNASAGQVFTVSISGGTISGATFDTPVAAPEPSAFAALAVGLLGLGALSFRARRRPASAV